jgi:hypothetical protein
MPSAARRITTPRPEDLVTAEEARRLFGGVSDRTLRRRVANGELTRWTIGAASNRVMYDRREISALVTRKRPAVQPNRTVPR